MPEPISRWIRLHPRWTLTLITIAALLPFIGKPFNVDDPLFIWAAHQIHAHPANPYGFNVNWDWRVAPMWKVTENPPLTCYYIALASGLLGWSEAALHFAYLLPVLAVILGTFRLARRFCNSPLVATLATLFTPVFLVSSTTLMSDIPMLAFWVWSVVFWMEGTEQNKAHKLLIAACLMALAEITKYYGFCLVPLLATYSICAKRRIGQWAQFLLIPLAAFWAYQCAIHQLYGSYPLFQASNFSFHSQVSLFKLGSSGLTGLAFTGGCLGTLLFFIPLLWRKWTAFLVAMGILIAAVISFSPTLIKAYPDAFPSLEIQLVLWAAVGLSALALAISEIKGLEPKSVLLVLWMIGTFSFTVFLNWTINARSILPMAPALGILIVRRLEKNFAGTTFPTAKIGAGMVASAVLALCVTEGDCLTAMAVRQNVRSIYADAGQNIGQLHFQGHWGFQYYMMQCGALPLDLIRDQLKPGDLVAIPPNNANLFPPAPGKAVLLKIYSEPGPPFLATISNTKGASFYASALGPIPFAFGRIPPETVGIYLMK
jgi:4-amino-4-deoxy-L-arabinose transferase-like glycosyltransferase